MSAILWLPLLVKALTTALLVVSASAAAERLGPVWGAIIASLPVSAGPAYVFLAMQQSPDFVAVSALNSAVGNGATGLFLLTYSTLARIWSGWGGLVVAVAAWLAAILVFHQVSWSVAGVIALNVCVFGLAVVLVKAGMPGTLPRPSARPILPSWAVLPLRAAAVAVFVSLVVAGSAAMGAAVTGFAAVFPISFISVFVILTPILGRQGTAQLAARALQPMMGYGAMMLVLHFAIKPLGVAAALGLALAVSVSWSCILLSRRPRGSGTNRAAMR